MINIFQNTNTSFEIAKPLFSVICITFYSKFNSLVSMAFGGTKGAKGQNIMSKNTYLWFGSVRQWPAVTTHRSDINDPPQPNLSSPLLHSPAELGCWHSWTSPFRKLDWGPIKTIHGNSLILLTGTPPTIIVLPPSPMYPTSYYVNQQRYVVACA